jgi:hypothetical protein
MERLLSCLGGCGRLALDDLRQQSAEVRLLDLVEAAGTVFAREIPGIWRTTDKAAHWVVATVKLDPIHDDEFIDDGTDLARDLGAFHLDLKAKRALEVVDQLLEMADKNNVLVTCVLELMKPLQELFCPRTSRSGGKLRCSQGEYIRDAKSCD